MKRFFLLVFLMPLSYCIGQDTSIAYKGSQTLTTKSFQEYIDAINKTIEFSGSIQVYAKGKNLFTFNQGIESIKSNRPISSDSKFAIASLTKSFTALKILQLIEDGSLDIHKTISDYLPYYPKQIGERITIEHLLNNRSGLPDYTAKHFEIKQKDFGLEEFIIKYCAEQLTFDPGSQYQYSNTGFYILGAIIEKVTGKSFKKVIEADIMNKAKMINSGVFERSKLLSASIVDGNENMKEVELFTPSILYSAGAIYSSTNDMVSWYKNLISNKLLSKEGVDDIFSGKPMQYYKGWGYIPISGKIGFGHTGGVTGFNTQMLTIPEDDIFVIILANNSPLPLRKIAADLGSIALGNSVELTSPKSSVKVPSMLLRKFVGTYQHEKGNNQIRIGVDKEQLYMLIGPSKRYLKAETFDKFYFDQFGPTIKFDFKGGQSLTWIENGNSYKYNHINSDMPEQKKTIKLSASDIELLTGEYVSKSDKIEILWESNELKFKYKGITRVLLQKTDWSFYYEESENGYYFKYPVDFKKIENNIRLVYDGNLPFEKIK